MLRWAWPIVDDALIASNPKHRPCTIWSSMQDDENLAIARRIAKSATVNPVAAVAVRGMVDFVSNWGWAAPVLSRSIQSFIYEAEGYGVVLPQMNIIRAFAHYESNPGAYQWNSQEATSFAPNPTSFVG